MYDRRTILLGAGGLTLCATVPPSAAGAKVRRRPPRLRAGDTVGLVEPAGFSDDQAKIDEVKSAIAALGLVPKVGRFVGTRHGYLAGTDQQRAADLNAMFADDEVRAIFAIRGGWGSARLLPLLDWRRIRANPKLLIGSSDITAVHLAIAARGGFPTIHGPNAASSWQEISQASLRALAFDAGTPTFGNAAVLDPDPLVQQRWRTATIRPGKARGRLLGGNLSVLAALAGTPWLPKFDGAILFLEDVGEAEYRIDRMLTQLALSGILRRVAGVVFGQCTRCTGGVPDYIGFSIDDLLRQHLAPLGVPLFSGANIGHVANQLCLPVGAKVEIDAGAGTIRVLERVVE